MLSDEVLNKVIERLTNRIEQANTYVLEQIGKSIKKIGALSPSNVQQLGQLIKYGGDYDKIVKKLAEITRMNVADIKKIFEEVAKTDYEFAKQFYKYRGQKFVPYDKNVLLKTQVDALANITANQYANISRTLAFTKKIDGKVVATPLAAAYQDALDSAILSVAQGKTSFATDMYRIVKELADSGLKTIDYESGRHYRLDSAVRTQMRSALRNLHNETQEMIGKDFDADGVEISVHFNPAPDHADIQGRQFSNKKKDENDANELTDWERIQNGERVKDYTGIYRQLEHSKSGGYRPISEYNCYHYIFAIILGVSQPLYNNEQLQKIIDDNNNGFELDGKHYTNYEGTQLQRQLELEIRKAKDEQIIVKASGIPNDISRSQERITALTNKYKELSNVSGLPMKMDRLRVSGYKRIDVGKLTNQTNSVLNIKITNTSELLSKWKEIFKNDNIEVRRILKANPILIDNQVLQVNNLINKYGFVKDAINKDSEVNKLIIQINTGDIMGERNYARFFGGHYIEFNESYFKDTNLLQKEVGKKINDNWWQEINTDNYSVYPVTHEFGHLTEFKMIEKIEHNAGYKGSLDKKTYNIGDLKIKEQIMKQVPDMEKYISRYGKSTDKYEWFAETFTQMELGNETPLTKALKKYIDEFMGGNYEYFR